MAFDQKGLDDYVDVAARIAEFRAKYPSGYLAPLNPAEPWQHVQVQGWDKNGDIVQQTFIVVVAAAYRDQEDASPGVGMAWEVFPGRTPYTRGSELMNAETSAWGRAIIALGAADSKRGIASMEEVRNRSAERDDQPQPLPRNVPDAQLAASGQMTRAQKRDHERLAANTVRSDGKAERSHPRGPDPDDPWTADAPVDGERAARLREATEDYPGSSVYEQQRDIAMRLAAKGITAKVDKLVFCGQVTGRDISSSAELSYAEAVAVLKAADALELVVEAP
jgi:hypothetical protein